MKKRIIAVISVLFVIMLVFGITNYDRIVGKLKSIEASVETKYTVSKIQEKENNLNIQTWNAVGDSITENDLYTQFVSKQLGIEYTNYGLASSTIAVNDTYLVGKSIYERVKSCEDADLWTVFGGVNDWYYFTPVGAIDDTEPNTFYGALKGICDEILKRPNNPKLILFTPLQSNRNGTNDKGVSMEEYRQAIIKVAELYNVPVIDLYESGGINSENLDKLTRDGVHPNLEGTKIYSNVISTDIIHIFDEN